MYPHLFYCHGKTADQVCQRHHDLRAGGYRRNIRRCCELAHNQQVHRAVHTCKNRANSTGSANKINGCKILPWVKVVFFSIFSILCSYGSTSRQLPHKKGWIRHGHFSPASYPAIVSFEQSTLRWLIASVARAVWFVNHIYCTFAHQMYTLPCYRPPDSSSILFIFCCNGGCALSGASSGKAV